LISKFPPDGVPSQQVHCRSACPPMTSDNTYHQQLIASKAISSTSAVPAIDGGLALVCSSLQSPSALCCCWTAAFQSLFQPPASRCVSERSGLSCCQTALQRCTPCHPASVCIPTLSATQQFWKACHCHWQVELSLFQIMLSLIVPEYWTMLSLQSPKCAANVKGSMAVGCGKVLSRRKLLMLARHLPTTIMANITAGQARIHKQQLQNPSQGAIPCDQT